MVWTIRSPSRWPEKWGDPRDRHEEYDRISMSIVPGRDNRYDDKCAHVGNLGYDRDWRTGMWSHKDEPHTWFTLEVLMALNPPKAPKPCKVCGYLTGFGKVCLCCD